MKKPISQTEIDEMISLEINPFIFKSRLELLKQMVSPDKILISMPKYIIEAMHMRKKMFIPKGETLKIYGIPVLMCHDTFITVFYQDNFMYPDNEYCYQFDLKNIFT